MFDLQKILEITKISKAEKWPFPKTLNALKEAGVENYIVEPASGSITYYGYGKQHTDSEEESLKNLLPSGHFDVKALKEAIQAHQSKRTPYSEFMREIMKAGVVRYRVDVVNRTCTYLGNRSGEEYAESFN